MGKYLWWRDGIIYQIYPRSFADSNNDGLGDLIGIISRLDYLQNLGFDAIWLSPIYPSPDKDFGYDISEYCDVDPRYGTLADFDNLVEEVHKRGMKIVMDMVLNHTSDQHPWFLESRSSRDNPKRDWYIWQPPGKSAGNSGRGKEPNNWQACFGGKAWEYDPPTGEYYLHLFAHQQPDVNWRNPQVRQAQLDVFRFWLKRGVDGFRLDVFNAYFKDPGFRDNPIKPGLRAFNRQHHLHDMDQPEMIPFLNELRTLLDSYSERFAVGETYFATQQKTRAYCGLDRLHAAFSFDFTSYASEIAAALRIYPWNPRWIMKQILSREKVFEDPACFPTTVLSNHDLPRAASRYIRGEDDRMAKILITLLLTLRGTPYMYQGEEIGMRDIPLKYKEIVDPPGRKYWPFYPGRDGCRSPMQWNTEVHAGFSSVKPWMKVHKNFLQRNVETQEKDPGSLLNFTRDLIDLRRKHPSLYKGDFIPFHTSRHLLAYLRKTSEESILVICNFSKISRDFSLPGDFHLERRLVGSSNISSVGGKNPIVLDPYEVAIFTVASD
jgi:alpha-glucosidase